MNPESGPPPSHTQEMMNSFPGAECVAPILVRPPLGGSAKPPALEIRDRQSCCVQCASCRDAAELDLRRLRIIFAGQLSGPRGKFRGYGRQRSPIASQLADCAVANMDIVALLMGRGIFLFAYTARSRADADEASRVPAELDRDRRLRVGDERRRVYRAGPPHTEARRYNRNNPPSTQVSPKDNGHELSVKSARKGRGNSKSAYSRLQSAPTAGK